MDESGAISALIWKIPGTPLSISLSLDAVNRLNLAVMEAFLALPKRGLEIGGLLLGRARRDDDGVCVEIDDFELLESDHAGGPSYLLSSTNRSALEQRLQSATAGSIVGFFRSHTRNDFAATAEDKELLSSYFSDSSDVFLLLRPHRDRAADAGFVVWQDGEIRPLQPYRQFPFRPAALMSGGYTIVQRAATLAKPQPATPAPVVQPAAPQAVSRARRRRTDEIAAASAIAALAILARIHGVSAPNPAPQKAPITASANTVAPTPVVQKPTPLAPVIQPQAPPPDSSPAPSAVNEQSPVERRDRTVGPPRLHAMTAVTTPPPSSAFRLVEPTPPEASPLPPAPHPNLPLPMLNIPPVVSPIATVAVDAIAPQAPRTGVLSKLHLRKGHPLADFTPPQAVRQTAAEISPELRRNLTKEVPVDVKLYIDRAGKVEYAELVSRSSAHNRDLATAALFASRQWRFSPARLEGEPVEAQVVLHYHFGPEAVAK